MRYETPPGRQAQVDLVKMIDHQLAESREDRLAATDIGLPPIFLEGY